MRTILALLLAAVALTGCSKPAPPQGRWEGAYDDGSTFIAARMEIGADGLVRVSAPDVTDEQIGSKDDQLMMRETMAQRLVGAWGEVAPRQMDFDGKHRSASLVVISAPSQAGSLPPSNMGAMTLFVRIGTHWSSKMMLRPVNEFSDNPWLH